jgi:Mlc titration factor MtfA (ptsG expression regulator)
MLFSWLTKQRRAKLLSTPFPSEWLEYLERNVPLYASLNEHEQAIVRDNLRILVAEKNWEGCGGLTMTDEIKVTIAANAALLLIGIDHDSFARVMSILVYPSGFRSPEGWRNAGGVVDLDMGALGQAWYDGPVILAWDAVLAGARDPKDGQNVVLHEFAHQLDYLDGLADGTPPLQHKSDYKKWHEVMTREFEKLKAEAAHGHPKVLDAYGATNHAEFFAVATEAFFEKSREMYIRHPELYAVLSEYYCQDPAARQHKAHADSEPTLEGSPPAPVHEKHTPTQALPGKRAYRHSRIAAKTPEHKLVSLDWPWWIQFWDIHPGSSRAESVSYLDKMIVMNVAGFSLLVLVVAYSYTQHWQNYLGLVFPSLLALTFLVLMVWFQCAVYWVDRRGFWGGQYHPAEKPEPKTEAPDTQAEEPPAGDGGVKEA